MKKILVIGSTVADVIINVDKLPAMGVSAHALSQKINLGGCAYNVSDVIRNFNLPYRLFSPVGTGIYGDFLKKELAKIGVEPIISDEDNGCCYCFVDKSGERTILSNHGAEYWIKKEWLESVDLSEIQSIYVCGLEIEEKTGPDIVEYLENHKQVPFFFAPGPRIVKVESELMDRILNLHPILHLNDKEIAAYTGVSDVEQAVKKMYEKTENLIIVTMGADGACWYDGKTFEKAAPVKCENIVDTIGAGDSHIGTIMACLYRGDDIRTAVETANKVASAVVGTAGAVLPREKYRELI